MTLYEVFDVYTGKPRYLTRTQPDHDTLYRRYDYEAHSTWRAIARVACAVAATHARETDWVLVALGAVLLGLIGLTCYGIVASYAGAF